MHGRGHAWQGMFAEEMGTEAGGTHPTGMHSSIRILPDQPSKFEPKTSATKA